MTDICVSGRVGLVGDGGGGGLTKNCMWATDGL